VIEKPKQDRESQKKPMQELVTIQRKQPRQTCFSCSIFMKWQLWVAVALIVVIAAAAVNWSWLAATGVTPVLLAVLPCLAMCALSLCTRSGSKDGTAGH
jgi:hypothetical protein